MSDFLQHLAAQALDQPHGLQLRVPSLYESAAATPELEIAFDETVATAPSEQSAAAASFTPSFEPAAPSAPLALETTVSPASPPMAAAYEARPEHMPAPAREQPAGARSETTTTQEEASAQRPTAASAHEPEAPARALSTSPPMAASIIAVPRERPQPPEPPAFVRKSRKRSEGPSPRDHARTSHPYAHPAHVDPFTAAPLERSGPLDCAPAPPATRMTAPARAEATPTTVSIAIGRIEVRLPPTAASEARPSRAESRVMTLDTYMRRRRQSRQT